MTWTIIAGVSILLNMYMAARIYKLRKALKKFLEHLADIERKIPVLKP